MKIVLTENFARASATDAANMQMRKAGRVCWNEADFNLAADTLARLIETGDFYPADVKARVAADIRGRA